MAHVDFCEPAISPVVSVTAGGFGSSFGRGTNPAEARQTDISNISATNENNTDNNTDNKGSGGGVYSEAAYRAAPVVRSGAGFGGGEGIVATQDDEVKNEGGGLCVLLDRNDGCGCGVCVRSLGGGGRDCEVAGGIEGRGIRLEIQRRGDGREALKRCTLVS